VVLSSPVHVQDIEAGPTHQHSSQWIWTTTLLKGLHEISEDPKTANIENKHA